MNLRTTHTYSTTNIVIDTAGLGIWAEDFSYETATNITTPFLDRVGRFVDRGHVRLFTTMHGFTMWLQEQGAVVDQCWMLGPELSDEERQP